MPPLILASASPRRRALLAEHGYTFAVEPAAVTEITPAHLTAGEITLYNARIKARAIARQRPETLVLGVDTLVAYHGEIFGKPPDLDAAFSMLCRLNGQTHDVYSGVWMEHANSGRHRAFVEITRVEFRSLSEERLHEYLGRIGPLDKAGAYAAQDDRGELIAKVHGSFTNVIGLPMETLRDELRHFDDVE